MIGFSNKIFQKVLQRSSYIYEYFFDLENDPYERHDVAKNNPEVVAELMDFAKSHSEKFYQN